MTNNNMSVRLQVATALGAGILTFDYDGIQAGPFAAEALRFADALIAACGGGDDGFEALVREAVDPLTPPRRSRECVTALRELFGFPTERLQTAPPIAAAVQAAVDAERKAIIDIIQHFCMSLADGTRPLNLYDLVDMKGRVERRIGTPPPEVTP